MSEESSEFACHPAEKHEEFSYPTSRGVIHSPTEFAEVFPEYLDELQVGERVRQTLQLVRTLEDSPKDVLDYGSGIGTFAYHLAKSRSRWTISGWDGDRASVAIAQSYFQAPNLAFHLEPYTAYRSLEPNSLDLISFLEVLEHVDRPGEFLEHFAASLRVGGHLLISTPHALGFNALTAELRRRVNRFVRRRDDQGYAALLRDTPHDPTTHLGHVGIYTLPALATLLKLHGFVVEKFELAPISKKIRHRILPETLVILARREDFTNASTS